MGQEERGPKNIMLTHNDTERENISFNNKPGEATANGVSLAPDLIKEINLNFSLQYACQLDL